MPNPKWNPWTIEEELWLTLNYRSVTSEADRAKFEQELSAVSGNCRTYYAAKAFATKTGVKTRDYYAGMPTLVEAGELLGVSRKTLSNLIRRRPQDFPVIRAGNYTFIPDQTLAALRAHYCPDPALLEATVDWKDAAKVLCVVPNYVLRLAAFGVLQSVKVGRYPRIYRDSLKRALDLQAREGSHWMAAIADELDTTYHLQRKREREELARRRKEKLA